MTYGFAYGSSQSCNQVKNRHSQVCEYENSKIPQTLVLIINFAQIYNYKKSQFIPVANSGEDGTPANGSQIDQDHYVRYASSEKHNIVFWRPLATSMFVSTLNEVG